jgi:Major intrinsic protein
VPTGCGRLLEPGEKNKECWKALPMKKYVWGKRPSVLAPLMLRRYLAEFLGTFAYVFFGCGTKILLGNKIDTLDNLLTFLVFGFT